MKRQSLPRMRGDRPDPAGTCAIRDRFTPHARGSTFTHSSARRFHAVYPACAGIDHCLAFYIAKRGGLPRMRGDRPYAQQLRDEKAQFTPHARGSTSEGPEKGDKPKVYPACAGIDR